MCRRENQTRVLLGAAHLQSCLLVNDQAAGLVGDDFVHFELLATAAFLLEFVAVPVGTCLVDLQFLVQVSHGLVLIG